MELQSDRSALRLRCGTTSSVIRKLSAHTSLPSLTMCQRFQSKQLSPGCDLDVRLAEDAGAIEDDGFLRQPCKFGGVTSFQGGQDASGFLEGSIDLLRCLSSDCDGRVFNRCHICLKSIPSGDTSRGIDKHSFLDSGTIGFREENANR